MRTSAPALKVIRGSLSALGPLESATLGLRVYRGLRDYLMAGQLQPGQKLTLRELAAALNVSPMIASFYGGTGLLIAVSVAFDLVQKIDSHLIMRNYAGLMSKR